MFVMGAQTNPVDRTTNNIQCFGRSEALLELRMGEEGEEM